MDTAQKRIFHYKIFFSKCEKTAENWDLVTLTEEIHHGKLHYLCSRSFSSSSCCFQIKKETSTVTCSQIQAGDIL